MIKIAVMHGPNLNLLGTREPALYGAQTLDDINGSLAQRAVQKGVDIDFFQSNAEVELIHYLHAQPERGTHFLIFNPAAFTHTSVALRDALLAIQLPFIEVHLSNIYKREAFRQHSYFRDIAVGVISGLGAVGYDLALQAAFHYLEV
ncbi:MAG: type II 3-dehydroquinate dehydratase [Gammaproteobacteria bacterium]|nr:type II 3-dehydroquinate dehydratase [Gammaproteobacteria bacterium]